MAMSGPTDARPRDALVLDVDNTLTPPRRPLEREMADVLGALTVPFCLDAGSDLPLVERQFLRPLHEFGFRGEIDAFLCNGARRYRCTFDGRLSVRLLRDFDLREHLGAAGFAELLAVLQRLLDDPEFRLPEPLTIIGERIVERGAMINFAPIGRPRRDLDAEAYRNRDAFVRFDRETGYRRRMLARLESDLRDVKARSGLSITLGGQTSFDICVAGNDKSYALAALLDEGYERLTFIGDALFPGGNDGAVLEFIERWPAGSECPVRTVRVTSWTETPERLREMGVVGATSTR
jgi:hydroxymethylpyrimidine pyrophosphatase-like HAD family hydrolase